MKVIFSILTVCAFFVFSSPLKSLASLSAFCQSLDKKYVFFVTNEVVKPSPAPGDIKIQTLGYVQSESGETLAKFPVEGRAEVQPGTYAPFIYSDINEDIAKQGQKFHLEGRSDGHDYFSFTGLITPRGQAPLSFDGVRLDCAVFGARVIH